VALILSCQAIGKSYSGRSVFEKVSLTISDGDRIGLIGPNGSGKTTLLKILAGLDGPDRGTVAARKLARAGYVAQDPQLDSRRTAEEVLAARLPAGIEETDRRARLAVGLGRAGLSGGTRVAELSGGWRKRLAIAEALAGDPELLLLDEPTNHLDVDGILWLEKVLTGGGFASVVVSHDRYFLENIANRVVEINRIYPEGAFAAAGAYSDFLEKREEFLHARAHQQEALENKVRREIEWLRRGPKARTGKSRARIDAAGRLIGELAGIHSRSTQGAAQVEFASSGRRTKRLLTAEGLGKGIGGRRLIENLDLTLSPGMRLGLLGANGSGKTTLLRLLSGEIQPDRGTIERAPALRTVYFDQAREQLDPTAPLRRALCPHGDSVIYQGRPIHVAGWAKRFLFRSEQLDLPVGRLSGGEQARVSIARLMLEPADLLLMDEPTNDLDIPTLEVLEETLTEFDGALILVTHDRHLLDRVSTQVLALDGEGGAEFFADLAQWQESRVLRIAPEKAPIDPLPERDAPAKRKLSYQEAREWESMEQRILDAEHEMATREAALQSPDVVSDPVKMREVYQRFESAREAADRLYARWAELEAKAKPG
jgi:ATP-binding cassette subfamily F protein uup